MSRERLTLPVGLVSFRSAGAGKQAEQPTAGGSSAGSAGPAGLSVAELKDLQRRAFERGAAVAREELADRFAAACAELAGASAALDAARAAERESAVGFVVELAIGLAEEMVGAALKNGAHDVRSIVESALHEALPLASGATPVAELNPEDAAELEHALALKPLSAGRAVEIRADAALPRGACRVVCGGAEVAADPAERMRAAGQRLRALASAALARGDRDAL